MGRRRTDEDFAAEVESHLQLEADRLVEDGLSGEEARAAARRAFGNATRAREAFHERSRWTWLEQFLQDLRYAWRGLRASPAFVGTAVLTLAAGLGLLTVAFTVFNAYVLRPFAVADPERLYRFGWSSPNAAGTDMSRAVYDELRGRTDLFDAAIFSGMGFSYSDARSLVTTTVSGNYFEVLRPRMLLGRPLTAGDGGQPVVVLAQQAWSRLFAGDPGAVGRTIDLNGTPLTVVGVVREEFAGVGDLPTDVWIPADPAGARGGEVVVRLRAGVTPPQAVLRLQSLAVRLAPARTEPREVRAMLVPSRTANPLSVELVAMLSPVFAAFALVLLAACFNVSNVMLARAIARQREIAVRLSLGASRARIVRQLLTEGLLIAALAGGCAVALAAWLIRGALLLMFSTLPPILASLLRVAPMPIDWRVLAFAFAAGGGATLLFGLVPALQTSRQSLTTVLHGQRSGAASSSRLRNGLVVAQVTVSIVLVVTALVLARNFTSLAALDLGYSTRGVYSVNVRDRQEQLIRPAAEALAADPRIAAVAVTSGNPLFATRSIAMRPAASAGAVLTRYTFVSPDFFPMLHLPITRGRAFRPEEAQQAAAVAIVSQGTADAFWPGADPIGRSILVERADAGQQDDLIAGYRQVTVIGTVPDVVSGLMFDGQDAGHVYLPATAADRRATAILIAPRAASDFRPDMLRETFRRLGLNTDLFEIVALEEMRQVQIYPVRAAAWVGELLGGLALLLSVIGLYGVLSYTLAQRTREIGIRMALGATAGAVIRLVMRDSARMAAVGAAIGLALSVSALGLLASVVQLRQIRLLDPLAFAAAVAMIAAATGLAAYGPARRATAVDPAETLRAEA